MEQLIAARLAQRELRPDRQRGIVVVISLIVLVVMTLAAVGLIRSMDTATVVSHNLTFKQVSLQLGDIGTEAATNELAYFAGSSADAAFPSGCAANGSCRYFPVMQTLSTLGVPATTNWSNVANISSVTFPTTFNGLNALPSGYTVQYVVERLCTGTLPITNISSNCYSLAPEEGGSKKLGSPVFTTTESIYYRATIRVADAKGASTLTQVILRR